MVLEKLENKSTRDCVKELIAISPQSVSQEKRRELTPDKTELRVVLNKDLLEKLDKIKNLLSNSHPNMTDQDLIATMAELTLKKIDPLEKAKRAQIRKAKNPLPALVPRTAASANEQSIQPTQTSINLQKNKGVLETLPEGPSLDGSGLKNQQPGMGVSPKQSRYIPSTIKCEVYMRDKGTCTHPNCNSRKYLEYDHIKPLALGGKTTVSNLRLLCRAHNQRAAIDQFGYRKMQSYILR